MTVNTTASSVTILGNGSNTTFTFSFAVEPDPTTIKVYLLDSLGNPTLLNSSVYTLTLNSPVTGQLWGYGGTVVYPLIGPPITSSTSIQISRNTPSTQETSLSNQGNFYPQTVEQGLDLLEMQTQELIQEGTYTFPTGFTPSSFDPAGAAATAQSNAEAFASNPANLPVATNSALGIVKPDGITLSISNGILSTLGGGSGLFSGILSAVPTQASSGFTTWGNKGSATATDNAIGFSIYAPSESNNNILRGLYRAVPGMPYTKTMLLCIASLTGDYESGACIGWYDGTKADVITFRTDNYIIHNEFSDLSTRSTYTSLTSAFRQRLFWVKLADDGTNVTVSASCDGENYTTVYTTTKSAGYLGSSGYTNLFIGTDAYAAAIGFTVMSWA